MHAPVFIALLCILALSTSPKSRADEQVLEELLVVRAQPAVFKVVAFGDIVVTTPKSVSLRPASEEEKESTVGKARTLLEQDYQQGVAKGEIDRTKSLKDYAWEAIADNPQRFLRASIDSVTETVRQDVVYSAGTGFAVSREGILLTNAHVLWGMVVELDDIGVAIEFLSDFMERALLTIASQVGEPSDAMAPRVVSALVKWLVPRSHVVAKFKHAEVVLKYDFPESFEQWRSRHGKFDETLLGALGRYGDSKLPLTVRADVLAAGEPYPGRDVAVLRIRPEIVFYRSPLRASERSAMIDARDRIICLPLGDSDLVLPGTRVQAMGFPSSAFDPKSMSAEAEFRMSSQDGQIGQLKPLKGGGNVLEMTALIDFGDSGGPVFDRKGNVIGLNVGGNTNARVTLAVPINVAKALLKKAGIKPDLGPLTKQWVRGLRAYGQGRYADAVKEFDLLMNDQLTSPSSLVYPHAVLKYKNGFVVRMWDTARRRMTK